MTARTDSFNDFLRTIGALLRAPRAVGACLATLIALTVSGLASFLLWLALSKSGVSIGSGFVDERATLLIPPNVDPSEGAFGVVRLLLAMLHQIPLVSDGNSWVNAPLILLAVPIIACFIAVAVARLFVPETGLGSFASRTLPFAALYAVVITVITATPAQSWHASFLPAFIYALLIAAGATALHDHIALSRLRDNEAAQPDASSSSASPPAGGAFKAVLDANLRTIIMMMLIGSLGVLLVNSIEAFTQDKQERTLMMTQSAIHVLEGGAEAVAYGLLAESEQFGTNQAATRVWQTTEIISAPAYYALMLTALGVVAIGGLFAGFAAQRQYQLRNRSGSLWLSVITGIVWAASMLIAQFVILPRARTGDDLFTLFNGTQTFWHALIIGTLLSLFGIMMARFSVRHGQ